MSDHGGHADHEESRDEAVERVTSPMQPFDARQVWIGVAVLAVGLLVTMVLPLALA